MKSFVRGFITLFFAGIAVLALAGCVATPPSEGAILNKTFAEAHDETYTVNVNSYDYGCHYVNVYNYSAEEYDYKNVCEFYHGDHGKTEDRVRHIPDTWTVLFEGKNSDDETVSRTIEVSESQYEDANKGYSIVVKDDQVFISPR